MSKIASTQYTITDLFDGVSILNVDVEYRMSDSATELVGGSWDTVAPEWVSGKYIWSRTKTTYSLGSPTYTQPACITGQAGANGTPGAIGTGVTSISEEYYLSSSKTTQTGSSWKETPDPWSMDKYLWTRSVIVYSNPPSTQRTDPIVDISWEASKVAEENANIYADAAVEDFISGTYADDYLNLQTQVDGKIETFFTSIDPSTAWTSTDLKNAHKGDMWYNNTTGAVKLKRWNGVSWDEITDQRAIDAYDKASAAQDTADGKRRIFTATPTTPYDVGDLWVSGASGDIKHCITAKGSGTYDSTNWGLSSKYTDDTVANTKKRVFIETPTVPYDIGDLWSQTSTGKMYTCTNSKATGASYAFADWTLTATDDTTANTKGTVYTGTEAQRIAKTGMQTGDIWVSTNLYSRTYYYTGSAWVLTSAGTIQGAALSWNVDTGTIDIVSGKKITIATGGVLELAGTSKLNMGSQGEINMASGSKINVLSGGNIDIKSGGTFTVGSTNFNIDSSGNVTITGEVIASSGRIGGANGFVIDANKMYKGKTSLTNTTAGVYIGTDGISLGSAGVAPQFKVTSDGAQTATSVDITGKVTATSGSFTGAVTATSGSFTGAVTATSGSFTGAVTATSGTFTGKVVAATGNIGDFTLSNGHLIHSDSGSGYFADISKWGAAFGQDASPPNYHFPVRITSQEGAQGHLVAKSGRIGALDFDGTAVAIKSGSLYGTKTVKIVLYDNGNIKTVGSIWAKGAIYCPSGTVTAGTFSDFTKGYDGDNALAEIKQIKNKSNGDIDHSTLPASARIVAGKKRAAQQAGTEDIQFEESTEDQRDIGAMVSILTKGIQELTDIIEAQNIRISKLEEKKSV